MTGGVLAAGQTGAHLPIMRRIHPTTPTLEESPAMSKPRLVYFDFAGSRGEECRIALHLAGVDFDDVRVAGADWPARKPQSPFGSMPILELDGQPPLGESNAILVYIGRQHGLHTHHAVAFHFAHGTAGVYNHPMPAQELHGVRAAIFYRDVVAENKFSFPRVRVPRKVFRFYANGNVVGGERFHRGKNYLGKGV